MTPLGQRLFEAIGLVLDNLAGISSAKLVLQMNHGKEGWVLVLKANAAYWAELMALPERTYSATQIQNANTLLEVLEPLARSGAFQFTASELLAMLFWHEEIDPYVCETSAGLLVPRANLIDHWTHMEFLKGQPNREAELIALIRDTLDDWSDFLLNYPWFDGNDPEHKAWFTIVTVPDVEFTKLTHADMTRVATLTMGWNFAEAHDSLTFGQYTDELLSYFVRSSYEIGL